MDDKGEGKSPRREIDVAFRGNASGPTWMSDVVLGLLTLAAIVAFVNVCRNSH
jgi:hypothetical protein